MKLFSIIGVVLMLMLVCMAVIAAESPGIESDVSLEAEMSLEAIQSDSPADVNGIFSEPIGYVIFYDFKSSQFAMIIVIEENWKNVSYFDMSGNPHSQATRRNPMLC